MKFLKYTLVFMLLLVAVAGSLAFALWQWVDTKQVVALIQDNVRDATGRELTINGFITPAISFYPTLELADISLSNPSWAKEPVALKAKTLKIGIALMPLLKGQTRITQVALDGAEIDLERSARGDTSWQMDAKALPAPQDIPNNKQSKAAKEGLTIEQLIVVNSTVHYRDHTKHKPLNVKVASLDIKGFNGKTLDHIAFEGRVNGVDVITTGSLTNGDMVLIDGTAKTDDNQLELKGSFAMKDLTFDMKLKLDAPKVVDIAKKFNVDVSNNLAAQASLTIGGTPDAISFSNLNAVINGNDVKGSGRVTIGAGKPYIEAQLTSMKLNLKSEPVIAASLDKAMEGDQPTAKPKASSSDVMFPKNLSEVNANVQWVIGEFVNDKMIVKDVSLLAELTEGVLHIKPLKMTLAGGTIDAIITYDSMATPPSLALRALMNEVVLGQVMEQISGAPSDVQGGKSMGEFRAKGQGNTLDEWLASANGTINFFVDQSTYQLDGITQKADSFVSVLSGKNEQTGKLPIECVAANFNIAAGIATSEWLALKTSNALATGSGTVSLIDYHMDMLLKARSAFIGFADVVPPLRLRGSMDNPKVKPDTMGSVMGIGKMVLGATTGVGLAAVLGEKAADKLGITSDNNPCLTAIAKIQQQPEPTADDFKNTVKKIEDAVKDKGDDLTSIKDNAKQLRDGFKGLFKK